MAEAPGSDLYVLPEMWSTGFATEPDGIAESESSSVSLSWMRATARRLNCAISGSLAMAVSNHNSCVPSVASEQSSSAQLSTLNSQFFVNRHYFIDGRSGSETYYDKHHLFTYGHEDRYYQPGSSHSIVEYCGFRILLLHHRCGQLAGEPSERLADPHTSPSDGESGLSHRLQSRWRRPVFPLPWPERHHQSHR